MKQKLIDANEFAIEEPKLWDWSSIDGISSTAVLKQCIWDVQCAPTVNAIPVEWLCRKYLDITKKNWSAVICLIVNKIIREWGKENAKAD